MRLPQRSKRDPAVGVVPAEGRETHRFLDWTVIDAAQSRSWLGLSSTPGSRFSILHVTVPETRSESEHFHVVIELSGVCKRKSVIAMVDSGASTLFINQRFLRKNNVRTRKLKEAIPVYNINRTLNKNGSITHVAVLNISLGGKHVCHKLALAPMAHALQSYSAYVEGLAPMGTHSRDSQV